jgi:uncharacterized protein (TIGR02271 family)
MHDRGITEGMIVRSSDGEKLGKVVACQADGFIVEKGFFFPKDYFATFENVVDVRGDEIYLDMTRDSFIELGRQKGETWGATTTTTAEKDVVTEEKHVTVPVRREEVRVERRPVTGEARVADTAFEKDTVRVPVTEEEVEIRKRPVVREEVRVSKAVHEEQRTASEPVRRETVDIDEEGSVRRSRLDDDDIDLKKT